MHCCWPRIKGLKVLRAVLGTQPRDTFFSDNDFTSLSEIEGKAQWKSLCQVVEVLLNTISRAAGEVEKTMNAILQQATALSVRVAAITTQVVARHIGRGDVARATWLSIVTGRPAFFLGTPGVDKTGTIQSLAGRIDGAVFYDVLMPTIVSAEQLLVESTSIEESPLPNGGKSIRTRDQLGRAASAHLLFADEIWKADPRPLQTLIDLSKGDGVRHEGALVKTPLKAFLAASNELPDPEGNLGAMWSRMTIRVVVDPLDRADKKRMVDGRLAFGLSGASTTASAASLSLEDIDALRAGRKLVVVPPEIVEIVLDIYQELLNEQDQDFSWLWADDRRFGRCFDVLQANALLDGRTTVGKQDLAVLEWMLWDVPEQIPVVRAKLAPYCRTPLVDAQEAVDSLLASGGIVQLVRGGDRTKGVQAITQCEACITELNRLQSSADSAMARQIGDLLTQVSEVKQDVIAVVTGARRP